MESISDAMVATYSISAMAVGSTLSLVSATAATVYHLLPRMIPFVNPGDRIAKATDGTPRKVTWEEAFAQTRKIHGHEDSDLQELAGEMIRLSKSDSSLSNEDIKRMGYEWFWNKRGRRPIIPK